MSRYHLGLWVPAESVVESTVVFILLEFLATAERHSCLASIASHEARTHAAHAKYLRIAIGMLQQSSTYLTCEVACDHEQHTSTGNGLRSRRRRRHKQCTVNAPPAESPSAGDITQQNTQFARLVVVSSRSSGVVWMSGSPWCGHLAGRPHMLVATAAV